MAYDWLTRHPRFHLHFTPTGSSWINQVERWFGYLTDQLLRRGVHMSVQALENDVRDWIKAWNEDPKPFVWTPPGRQGPISASVGNSSLLYPRRNESKRPKLQKGCLGSED